MGIYTQIDVTKSGALSLGSKGFRTGKTVMTFDNEASLVQLLRGIPPILHHYIIVDSLAKTLKPMQQQIKANAPRHTGVRTHRGVTYKPGNLRRAIKIRKSKNPKRPWASVEVVQGRGMPDGWYARFFEWGTVGRATGGGKPNSAAQYHRFFSRGIDTTRKQVQRLATVGLQELVQKEVDKKIDAYNRKATKMTLKMIL